MYPPETSLLPLSVVTSQFVERHGIRAFTLWFDNWYLGVPFRFIAEPVVPILAAMVHKLMPSVSLLGIMISFAVVSLFLGSVGWSILFSLLSPTQKQRSFIVFFLLIVVPWRYLDALTLSSLPLTVSRAVLPFVLIAYWRFISPVQSKTHFYEYGFLALLGTLSMFLTSISITPIFLIGVISLLVARGFKKGRVRISFLQSKQISILIALSFLGAVLWYTPRYFQTLIFNPSLGGLTPVSVLTRLYRVLRGIAPMIAAISFIVLQKSKLSRRNVFTGVWGGTFILITGFRFVSDVDFWMDWTAWITELEIGLVFVVVSLGVSRKQFKYTASIALSLIVVSGFVYSALGRPALISQAEPDAVSSSFDIVRPHIDSRMFLSGSDTFWSGLMPEVTQVRGGRDSLATHPYWDHASYQIREGTDAELVSLWAQALGIRYVLVHTALSDNYYHDFKTYGKWKDFESVEDDSSGNQLIDTRVESRAWEVNEGILMIDPPEKGDDFESLREYVSYRTNPVALVPSEDGYTLFTSGAQVVQIAVSYDPKWHAYDEVGNEKRVVSDPLGNIVVFSNGAQEIGFSFEW